MAEAGGPAGVPPLSEDEAEGWRLAHHALRQPLNALGLFCAALKMQPLTDAQTPLVAGIEDAAQSLERLVDHHFAVLRGRGAQSPLDPTPVTVTAVAVAPNAAGAEPPARSSAWRIVVVDDDDAARLGMVMLLEAWGATVQAFASIQALRGWTAGASGVAPDLLILDYHLPRPGDGLEALRLLRQAWPGTPLRALLITGDERAAVANALTDGSLECLVKPVTPGPLLAALRHQLGSQFGV